MSQSSGTVTNLEMLCRQIAPVLLARTDGYQPTPNQIYFFTLVWVLNLEKKKPTRFIGDNKEPPTDLGTDGVEAHAREVARHLSQESGEIVTKLQIKDAQTWIALADLLMRNTGKDFDCPKQIKEDAAANGLEKMVKVIGHMVERCPAHLLDIDNNISALAIQLCSDQIRIYDFRTHFYNFAQWIVRNELISLLRKTRHEEPFESLEELLIGSAPDDILGASEKNAEMRQWLKAQLIQLLSVLPSLTEKRLLVISHTLAARPQFWLALELTELSTPETIPQPIVKLDDESIGLKLNMTATNVRAHRSNAYAQLRRDQPTLAELLLTLMKVNLIDWEFDL